MICFIGHKVDVKSCFIMIILTYFRYLRQIYHQMKRRHWAWSWEPNLSPLLDYLMTLEFILKKEEKKGKENS